MHPCTGSHVSLVQGLLSSQLPGVHCVGSIAYALVSIPRTTASSEESNTQKRTARSPYRGFISPPAVNGRNVNVRKKDPARPFDGIYARFRGISIRKIGLQPSGLNVPWREAGG